MIEEQLIKFNESLLELGFKKEKNSEFNRFDYTNDNFIYKCKSYRVELRIDKNTLKVVVWRNPKSKASKCFNMWQLNESNINTKYFIFTTIGDILEMYG